MILHYGARQEISLSYLLGTSDPLGPGLESPPKPYPTRWVDPQS